MTRQRILAIWTDCRARFGGGGDFLFGRFSIADAMYAPVVLRFQTYGVALAGTARAYADAVLALPALQAWVADAVAETERFGQVSRPTKGVLRCTDGGSLVSARCMPT